MPGPDLNTRIVSIAITLAALPFAFAGFGKLGLLVDGANSTLNGERVREYRNATAVNDDETAGYLSASVANQIRAALSQPATVEAVKAIRVDTAGPETYPQGLDAGYAADPDFYAITLDVRDQAIVAAVSAHIEAFAGMRRHILIFQDDDTDWQSAGKPAALASTDNRERTIGVFHTTDAKPLDTGYASNRLAFDQDVKSPGWKCAVSNVDPWTADPGDAAVSAMISNAINVAGTFGPEGVFVYPGVNTKGRPVYEVVTRDLVFYRLQEATTRLILDLAAQGDKLTVNLDGQRRCLNVARGVFRALEGTHFDRGQVVLEAPPITQADRDANRIRVTGRAKFAEDADTVSFDLHFTDQIVNPDADAA